ncbi:N-acetylmuramoyl-L-alanine amidase [Paenibacillus sp. FJAT-26967]|uniref:N-acetylmuramoyl-L-alanine amidase family protein n=1 Tax=Paenibacillus sp. FJAT-26967 TaxID=1729690 RepID=UPI000837ECFA|nr:N-acetylmuramoyl-L-alanine amidase [Paenibacillus sp. FJAT-26967]
MFNKSVLQTLCVVLLPAALIITGACGEKAGGRREQADATLASQLAASAEKNLGTGKASASSASFSKPEPERTPVLSKKAPQHTISDIDVLIDVGHGGIDGGAVHGALLEKDINLAIARLTYTALTQKGYRVVLNRDKDYALSDDNKWLNTRSRHIRDLAQRMQMANDIKPKILISLHVNSALNRSKKGPIVLHQNNPGSLLLATQLQERLNSTTRTSFMPMVGKTYYLLKRTKCPSVIIEVGFITNAEDRIRMTDPKGQLQIAHGIRDGVTSYLTQSGIPSTQKSHDSEH